MKITLKQLDLINFKGAKNQTINFSPETIISGRNKTGKSTIFDAFTWLLFGKDAQDRKDFSVKTYDENGNVIDKLDHTVTGVLVIDGVEHKLSRTLKEKWVKKQGKSTTEFTGNETVFFINDVPYQSGEYQKYIDGIIPEATFKLLTSPTYFNSLKWADRREMLISIVGSKTDEELAGNDLVSLLELMRKENKSMEMLKKQYVAQKNILKETLSKIPSRIDEVVRATPEQQDWKVITLSLEVNKAELENIEKSIADASVGVEDKVRERSSLLIDKSNLEQQISNLEFAARQEFQSSFSTKENSISQKQSQILSLKQRLIDIEYNITQSQTRIAELTAVNDDLRTRWTVRNKEQHTESNSLNCDKCGQSLPDDLIEQINAESKGKFDNLKRLDLSQISKQGEQNKEQIEIKQTYINQEKAKSEELKSQIAKLNEEVAHLQSQPAVTKSVEFILSENKTYVELLAKHAAIVIPESIQPADTTELKAKKAEVISAIEFAKTELQKRDMIEAQNKRKAELLEEETTLARQITAMEKIESQIDEFSTRKMNDVEQRVNNLFPTVRFRMFNQLINGGYEPTCECLINGVPFSDANTAGKINAGVEIINVFSQVHNMSAPIFCDNAESVNNITQTESQIIKMYVTTENVLTVS